MLTYLGQPVNKCFVLFILSTLWSQLSASTASVNGSPSWKNAMVTAVALMEQRLAVPAYHVIFSLPP